MKLSKVLTELVFRQSQDQYLLDYNFNVETVLCSDTFSKVNEPLLVLELVLASNEDKKGRQLRRVVVEMNAEEARVFVARLSAIEKEVVAASN